MGYYKKSHPHRDEKRHARKTACRRPPWEDAENPDLCPCCNKALPPDRDICPLCERRHHRQSDASLNLDMHQ